MIKSKVKLNLIIKYVILLLAVVSLAMLFVPGIKYVTLATNNVYQFSMLEFVDAMLRPDVESNMIIANYFSNVKTGFVTYGMAVSGIIIFIIIVLLFVSTIGDYNCKTNTYFYLTIANFLINLFNFVSACLFVRYITNLTKHYQMGTQGSLLGGIIVMFGCSIAILVAAGFQFFNKNKKEKK